MKQVLAAWVCLMGVAGLAPRQAEARPPTANEFHLGAGIGLGDTFEEGALDAYGFALALRVGFTLRQGLYLGAMADLYFGSETTLGWIEEEEPDTPEEDFIEHQYSADATGSGRQLGIVVGFDLKMAASVSGRLTVMGGVQQMEINAGMLMRPNDRPPDNETVAAHEAVAQLDGQNPFFAPSFEMILKWTEHVYLAPGARLNVIVADELNTVATFTFTLGTTF